MPYFIKNKSFGALLLSSVFTGLGANIFNLVFLLYAADYKNAEFYVSLAAIANIIPVFFASYAGFLADKTKSKAPTMVAVSCIQALLYLLMVGLFFLNKSLAVFLGVVAINVISDLLAYYKSGLQNPILQKHVETEQLTKAFGQMQGISAIIQIIAQPIGLILIAITPQPYPFIGFVNAVLYLIAGLIIQLFIKHLAVDVEIKKESFDFDIKGTFQQIKMIFTAESKGSFILIFVSVIMGNFLFSGFSPLINLSFLNNAPFGNYGLTIVVFNVAISAGLLIGSLIMKDFFRKFTLVQLLCTMFLLSVIFSTSLSHIPVLSALAIFGAAYVSAKINPKVSALLVSSIPADQLGRVSGGISTIFTFSIPIGSTVFVLLANSISPRYTLYIIAGISLLFFISLLFPAKQESQVAKQEKVD